MVAGSIREDSGMNKRMQKNCGPGWLRAPLAAVAGDAG